MSQPRMLFAAQEFCNFNGSWLAYLPEIISHQIHNHHILTLIFISKTFFAKLLRSFYWGGDQL